MTDASEGARPCGEGWRFRVVCAYAGPRAGARARQRVSMRARVRAPRQEKDRT